MAHLSSIEASDRFQYFSIVRRNTGSSPSIAALIWVDRDRRYFISSALSTNAGEIRTRKRWTQTDDGALPVNITYRQPELVDYYYSVCGRIDHHNRCRQADLISEKKVQTKSYAFRDNSTILSMIIVDCWLVCHGWKSVSDHISQSEFYEKLAVQLIDFDFSTSSNIGVNPTGNKSNVLLMPTRMQRLKLLARWILASYAAAVLADGEIQPCYTSLSRNKPLTWWPVENWGELLEM